MRRSTRTVSEGVEYKAEVLQFHWNRKKKNRTLRNIRLKLKLNWSWQNERVMNKNYRHFANEIPYHVVIIKYRVGFASNELKLTTQIAQLPFARWVNPFVIPTWDLPLWIHLSSAWRCEELRSKIPPLSRLYHKLIFLNHQLWGTTKVNILLTGLSL